MVILIGGAGHAGKTYMAQKLLEKYHYPYLSLDHLKMGLYRADIGCGFTPLDSTEHISEKLWPIIAGIIKTNIENKQNITIEGCYLLPYLINGLDEEYRKNIISFYLDFSQNYIERFYDEKMLRFRDVIEARGYENSFTKEQHIEETRHLKELYAKENYFEITADYQTEIEQVYAWIDKEVKKMLRD